MNTQIRDMTHTCFKQADILCAKHCHGCGAEEEGERKRGRGAGGADYIKAEYARRMAALEEALQSGPLWATDEDESDARALADAEELVEQVRLSVPKALQGVLRLMRRRLLQVCWRGWWSRYALGVSLGSARPAQRKQDHVGTMWGVLVGKRVLFFLP